MKKNLIIALATLAVVVALGACDKHGTPPPITSGKCLADIYQGATAINQTCTYVGYSWSCEWSATAQKFACKRGPEAAAATERAPASIFMGGK